MSVTTLQPPGVWAQQEFALAELGDPRRNRRLVNVATQLAASPGESYRRPSRTGQLSKPPIGFLYLVPGNWIDKRPFEDHCSPRGMDDGVIRLR
jgi:hypothetical protein